jgi:hypothetical protein
MYRGLLRAAQAPGLQFESSLTEEGRYLLVIVLQGVE